MENENRNEQNPEYQWQPYTSGSYNLNGQGTGGDAPLDKNGNPMQNRFGLKLTASIFEMLACNLISLICGIIGCIFTVNANKAYKEERWEDFKSARKASAVSLWIGFVAAVLYIILIIFMAVLILKYSDELDSYTDSYYGYDIESDILADEELMDELADNEALLEELFGTESIIYEDENAGNETVGGEGVVIPGEGFTTPEITIDGQFIELPIEYADLNELGFSVENDEYIINIGEYECPDLLNATGDLIGYLYVANATEEPIACKDGIVFAIVLYLDEWQDVKPEFELYNGITAATTEEEVLEIFGTPDDQDIGEEDTYRYAYYEWYMHHPYFEDEVFNSIDFTYVDGEMYEMGIYYLGW